MRNSRSRGSTGHSGQLEELDVEGILAFAERVLPHAADLWVQASLEQRQRFQQLFFPDGIAFDGKGFVGTRVTAPAFSYLREIESENERMVDLTGIEPLLTKGVSRGGLLAKCRQGTTDSLAMVSIASTAFSGSSGFQPAVPRRLSTYF